MRRASVFTALILSVFAVQSASAAVIGVRGGDPGSPPATDGSWFEMTECSVLQQLPPGYHCFVYENPFWEEEGSIFALDFQFRDGSGEPILAEDLNVSGFSDFMGILILNDITIRLCADSTEAGQTACDTDAGGGPAIFDQFFTVFSDDARSVRILAVNTVPNQIPEPGMLLLMGLGVATVAGRRLRNRRN